jgi:hypothetical protein
MMCLFCQAEARAEFAERSVQKLQKEVDRLEGKSHKFHRFVTDLYCLIEFIAKHLQIIFKCSITYNLTGGLYIHTHFFKSLYLPDRVDSDYISY